MNLLKHQTSPYLLQHKDNPVAWEPWGEEAFAKAAREGKPVLLSIGYSSCHWCHVMAHESFEDPETARLMNESFVSIKVDREERPDVDMLYQQALSLMGKQGGWPLTMFLTPDKKPFWGGTYFPPEPKYGMPSFVQVLDGVAKSYGQESDKIAHNAASMIEALERLQESEEASSIAPDILAKIAEHYLSLIDPVNGGLGGAPKFPQLCVVGFLWQTYLKTLNARYKSAVVASLLAMCQGGIYDHTGGGFHRYTVDAGWLVPHFEKMLYDNALFLSVLSDVYAQTKHPVFRARLEETAAFMLKELRVGKAFATALDADSEGEEGKFYVWNEAEIDAVLGDDSAFLKQRLNVTRFGNWESVNILNRLQRQDWLGDEEEKKLSSLLKKLNTARDKRPQPFRDEKVLADLNGLAITGLAKAAAVLDDKNLREAAQAAFDEISKTLCVEIFKSLCDKDGWLSHAKDIPGLLEDYAYMIEAALTLGDTARAVSWADILLDKFFDQKDGGFFMTETDTAFGLRLKSAHDNPLPSGNGVMVANLHRLFDLTGDKKYFIAAQKTLNAFSGAVRNNFYPYATLLAAQNPQKPLANDV